MWASSDAHVDAIDIRGMMGTLLAENTIIRNIGSSGIFLGNTGRNNTYVGSTCLSLDVSCFEEIIVRNSTVDTCAPCRASPNNALNTRRDTFNPSYAPGSSILLEHVSTPMGLNAPHGIRNSGASRSVDTITIRNSIGTWGWSCTFAMNFGVNSITFDNNALQHTGAGAACSADEDETVAASNFVAAKVSASDLRLVDGADAIACGDTVTFSPFDVFGTARPLGGPSDCDAHEKG